MVRLAILAVLLCLAFGAPASASTPPWFWTWAQWRLGHDEYRCHARQPSYRPDAPARIPAWAWRKLENHRPGTCPKGVTPTPPVTPPAPTPVAPVLESGERALTEAANDTRAAYGLARLPIDGRLERAARERTEDMVAFGYFAHEWHDGTPFATWIERYWPCPAGEILVRRTPSLNASQAVELWLASPGHRANLLSPDWAVMGVELTATHGTIDFGGACP